MDKKIKWSGLIPIEKERLVLSLTEDGMDVAELAERAGIKEQTIIRFMRSRGYVLDDGSFITVQEKEVKDVMPVIKGYEIMPFNEQESINKMNYLIENAEVIASLVEMVKSGNFNFTGGVEKQKENAYNNDNMDTYDYDVINTTLDIPKLDGEIKRTTIRVNSDLYDKLNELWRSKYPKLKQHDLINKALYDFIVKYR